MNILSLKPKHLAYVTRMQNNTNMAMFDPKIYQPLLNYEQDYTKYRADNDILSFDKQINDFNIISIVNDDYINDCSDNTLNFDTPPETLGDMTLVNSSLEYTEISNINRSIDCSNQSIQNDLNISYNVATPDNSIKHYVNNKRSFDSYNEDNHVDEYAFQKKIKLDSNQDVPFDPMLIYDNVEIILNNDYNSFSNEENNFANSKLLQNPNFPIFTNEDINDTVISSFDPIFFSEEE